MPHTSLRRTIKQFKSAGKQVKEAFRTRNLRKAAMKKATTTKQKAAVLRRKF